MTRSVLLAGEGTNELGGWAVERQFRAAIPDVGALEALLRLAAPEGWEIKQAVNWKSLPFYRSRDKKPKDQLNTEALFLLASEAGCDAIVFSRDFDGVEDRRLAVQAGLAELDRRASERGWVVVGGLAVLCIEAWVLALQGVAKTESMGRYKASALLAERGAVDTAGMVRAIQSAAIEQVARDAAALAAWLNRASRLPREGAALPGAST